MDSRPTSIWILSAGLGLTLKQTLAADLVLAKATFLTWCTARHLPERMQPCQVQSATTILLVRLVLRERLVCENDGRSVSRRGSEVLFTKWARADLLEGSRISPPLPEPPKTMGLEDGVHNLDEVSILVIYTMIAPQRLWGSLGHFCSFVVGSFTWMKVHATASPGRLDPCYAWKANSPIVQMPKRPGLNIYLPKGSKGRRIGAHCRDPLPILDENKRRPPRLVSCQEFAQLLAPLDVELHPCGSEDSEFVCNEHEGLTIT